MKSLTRFSFFFSSFPPFICLVRTIKAIYIYLYIYDRVLHAISMVVVCVPMLFFPLVSILQPTNLDSFHQEWLPIFILFLFSSLGSMRMGFATTTAVFPIGYLIRHACFSFHLSFSCLFFYSSLFLPNLARKNPSPCSSDTSLLRLGKNRTVPARFPSTTSWL